MTIIKNSLRFLAIAFTCAILFFSNVYPAAAIGSTKSSVKAGEENLNKIQKETDKSVTKTPLTIEEVQKSTEGGPNEIQGSADLEKMKNPENTEQATSFVDEIKGALDKATK